MVELRSFSGTVILNITDTDELTLYIGWEAIDPSGDSDGGGGGGSTAVLYTNSTEDWNVIKAFINGKELPDTPVSAMVFEKHGEETTGPLFFVLNEAPITGASVVQVLLL